MPTSVSAELPPEVVSLLSGDDSPARLGTVIPVLTADAAGFPHVALLSPGEILAVTPGSVRIAVDQRSTTARNIAERGSVTLVLVEPGLCCYAKGLGKLTDVVIPPGPVQPFAAVRADVEVKEVRLDEELGAWISTGARYGRDVSQAEELAYWDRVQGALRA